MTQMQYVPENQTDYIFSVAGEELGFLGCLLIIILLMALIIRLFYVAYRASTPVFGADCGRRRRHAAVPDPL